MTKEISEVSTQAGEGSRVWLDDPALSRKKRALSDWVVVGQILKALRLERGISHRVLADALGKSEQVIYHYEAARSEIPHDIALRLAGIFQVESSLFVPIQLKLDVMAGNQEHRFLKQEQHYILSQVIHYPTLGAFLVRVWIHQNIPLSREFLMLFGEARALLASSSVQLPPDVKMYLIQTLLNCQESILQQLTHAPADD